MRQSLWVPLLAALMVCTAAPTRARTLWVDAAASGAGADGSPRAPFAKINDAAQKARPGDTVLVRDGVYRESVWLVGGTARAWVTYKAAHKWGARIVGTAAASSGCFHYYGGDHDQKRTGDPALWRERKPAAYAVVDGFDLSSENPGGSGTWFFWVHHVTVRNCRAHDFAGSGLSACYCDYVTFEDNVISGNAARTTGGYGSGFSVWKVRPWDARLGFHNVIRGNTVFHNFNKQDDPKHSDGEGIIIDTTAFDRGTLVEKNVIFDNGSGGIVLDGAARCTVRFNTLYQNGWDPGVHYPEIYLQKVSWEPSGAPGPENVPCRDCSVYGNVIYARPDRNALKIEPDSQNCTARDNLRWGGLPGDTAGKGDIAADPQFVRAATDPALADFHLRPGSPAAGKGAFPRPGKP